MFQKAIRSAILPITLLVLLISTSFALLQYSNRLGQNESILNVAEGVIQAVEKNRAVLDNQPQDQLIDPKTSNSIFIQAYNDDGSIAYSNLGIDGNNQSKVPQGVLDNAKKDRNMITWAPKKDIRLAIVAQKFNGEKPGIIVTGKSLRDSDSMTDKIGKRALIALAISTIITLLACFILALFDGPRRKKITKIDETKESVKEFEKEFDVALESFVSKVSSDTHKSDKVNKSKASLASKPKAKTVTKKK